MSTAQTIILAAGLLAEGAILGQIIFGFMRHDSRSRQAIRTFSAMTIGLAVASIILGSAAGGLVTGMTALFGAQTAVKLRKEERTALKKSAEEQKRIQPPE